MTNTTTTPVEILITGPLASGKSTLLHLLGGHLKRNGWNVQCFEPDERRPIAPAPSLVNGIQDGRPVVIRVREKGEPVPTSPLVELALRLLEATEALSDHVLGNAEAMASGDGPSVTAATEQFVAMLDAAMAMRHGVELNDALNSQGIADEITCPIQGLIAMHGLLLDVMPEAFFELTWTQQNKWAAYICDKPGFGANRVLTSGHGNTAAEACDDAIDDLLTRPDEVAEMLDNEIPY